MAEKIRCDACGADMARDVRPDEIAYKGRSVVLEQPGWYCESCDEVVFDEKDAKISDGEFVKLRAKVDGLLTPAEVTRIRTKLGLSQRRAGALLGGGPRAFQKYESGKDWVTKSMANLLRLLEHDPSGVAFLAARSSGGRCSPLSRKKTAASVAPPRSGRASGGR